MKNTLIIRTMITSSGSFYQLAKVIKVIATYPNVRQLHLVQALLTPQVDPWHPKTNAHAHKRVNTFLSFTSPESHSPVVRHDHLNRFYQLVHPSLSCLGVQGPLGFQEFLSYLLDQVDPKNVSNVSTYAGYKCMHSSYWFSSIASTLKWSRKIIFFTLFRIDKTFVEIFSLH